MMNPYRGARHLVRCHTLKGPQLAELKKLVGNVGPTNAALVLGCSPDLVEELQGGGPAMAPTIARVAECLDILRGAP